MNIPSTVKVGGVTYKVTIAEEVDGGRASGQLVYQDQTITLSKGGEDFLGVTFLHELIHAMNSEIPEIETDFLAQGFYQLVKDNPGIFSAEKKLSVNNRKEGEKNASKEKKSRMVSIRKQRT